MSTASAVKTPARILTALASLIALAVYLLRLDQAAGLFKDDGWYIVMGKAIATGHGLTLISFPVDGGLYFYPPGFPLVLSAVFAISPDFPENVWLLKSVSIIALAAAGYAIYRLALLRDLPQSIAALIAFCTVLAPSWVFLATSTVMSECLFFALQMAALVAAQHALGQEWRNRKALAWVALLATLSYLTRSAGIVIIVAVAAYLVMHRQLWRALSFVLLVAVMVTPWTLYQRDLRSKAPAAVQEKLPKGYGSQIRQRAAGTDTQSKIAARELPLRIWQNVIVIIAADTGALLLPAVFRTASESGEEVIDLTNVAWVPHDYIGWGKGTMGNALGTKLLSLLASLVILTGYFLSSQKKFGLLEIFTPLFLATIVIWPGPTFRYLLPLSPLFLYYFVIGLKAWLSSLQAGASHEWMFPRAALLCILALYLYDHGGYIAARQQPATEAAHPDWLRKFEASKAAAGWIRANTAEKEIVTGDNLPMTYLYTGRKTDKCRIKECRQQGIRFYLRQQDIYDFPAQDIRYQSPIYNQVRVAELN
ncbi:MAG TPA: hypothetical protein VM009_04795 [Terriglobales bacterium]|nr:hypothetical protein [Terriglobales bacterium]